MIYNMYFAQMRHFGFHYDCAGITGISSCLGVMFVGERPIFAAHLPSSVAIVNKQAADAFVTMVREIEHHTNRGRLFVFTNGGARQSAQDEAAYLRGQLGNPTTTLYRIGSFHLGKNGADPRSVAVMVKHDVNNLVMLYKHIPEPAGWEAKGKPSIGTYKPIGAGQYATGVTVQRPPASGIDYIVPKASQLRGGWHWLNNSLFCKKISIG